MQDEPVMTANSIVAAVQAVIVAAVALGVWALDDGQIQAIVGAVGAVAAIVLPVAVNYFGVRNKVVPESKVAAEVDNRVRQRMASPAELRGPQHDT